MPSLNPDTIRKIKDTIDYNDDEDEFTLYLHRDGSSLFEVRYDPFEKYYFKVSRIHSLRRKIIEPVAFLNGETLSNNTRLQLSMAPSGNYEYDSYSCASVDAAINELASWMHACSSNNTQRLLLLKHRAVADKSSPVSKEEVFQELEQKMEEVKSSESHSSYEEILIKLEQLETDLLCVKENFSNAISNLQEQPQTTEIEDKKASIAEDIVEVDALIEATVEAALRAKSEASPWGALTSMSKKTWKVLRRRKGHAALTITLAVLSCIAYSTDNPSYLAILGNAFSAGQKLLDKELEEQ